MKKITLLFALMITSLGFAQQVLIEDFETPANYTFAGFEGLGSAAIVADPVVPATKMMGLQMVSVTTGQPWQGAEVVLQNSKIRLTTDKTIKVDVYSTKAFSLLGKVEMGTGPNSAAAQAYTTPGAWQTLTFTFDQVVDGQGIANGDYQKIVFFPNWNGNFGTPATNFTVHVDNITGVKAVVVPPAAPSVAAPTPPNRNAADVISIFSDVYANITIDNWNAAPIWYAPTGKTVQDVSIAGNATKKVDHAGDGFIGVDFSTLANHIDLTAMERFHMDIWTDTATLDKSYNLKLSNFKGDNTGELNAIEFSTTNASNPALPNPNPGTWISLDMPLSAWTSGARNNIAQFIVTSNLGTVYFDNVYIYKGTALGTDKFETSSVKMYPNPVKNTLTIEANSEIQRVSVYNILGQEVLKASPKSNTATLQTNELQKGVYLVTTEIDGKMSTSKVVKE